jgi:hypothetical protein
MQKEENVKKLLKLCLLVGAIDGLIGGPLVVLLANTIHNIFVIHIGIEPLFVRTTGLFMLFMGYQYYLAFRDYEKYISLVQTTILLRVIFMIANFLEAFLLLERPFSFPNYYFLAMGVFDMCMAATQIYCLKKLGKRWLVLSKAKGE